jgi:hypothetical protein
VVLGHDSCPSSSPSANRPTNLGIELIHSEDPIQEHLDWAIRSAAEHPECHIAVVVNTVSSCIDLADAVQHALPHDDVLCLHSRMTQGHRNRIEEIVLDRTGPNQRDHGRRLILVATQVVEASLDIDFDLMASDIAPSSSLIQRAGRLWRFHERAARQSRHAASRVPPSRILRVVARTNRGDLTFSSCLPYLAAEITRVRDGLVSRPTLVVPDDVQAFVDETTIDLDTFFTLMDQSSEHARRELVEMVKRHAAAQDAKASLADSICTPRHPAYKALMNLTTGNDPDEMMTTRFIERLGHTYLLIDPTRSRPDIAWASTRDVAYIAAASATAVIDLLPFALPVGGSELDAKLLTLHEATIAESGIHKWEPHNRMLRGLLPLDVGLLSSTGQYSDFLGLCRFDCNTHQGRLPRPATENP